MLKFITNMDCLERSIVIGVILILSIVIWSAVIDENEYQETISGVDHKIGFVSKYYIPPSTTYIKSGNALVPVTGSPSYRIVYKCKMKDGNTEFVTFKVSEQEYHRTGDK